MTVDDWLNAAIARTTHGPERHQAQRDDQVPQSSAIRRPCPNHAHVAISVDCAPLNGGAPIGARELSDRWRYRGASHSQVLPRRPPSRVMRCSNPGPTPSMRKLTRGLAPRTFQSQRCRAFPGSRELVGGRRGGVVLNTRAAGLFQPFFRSALSACGARSGPWRHATSYACSIVSSSRCPGVDGRGRHPTERFGATA